MAPGSDGYALSLVIGLALLATARADAQAISPSWDPTMAGQGMVLRDMNKAQTRRLRNHGYNADAARKDGLSPNARATRRNKQRAIAVFGANDPRTRQLYALCAQAGY